MDAKIEAYTTLTFVRGGVAKNGKKYLQCSNGRSEFFLNIPKDANIDENTFDNYEEDSLITVKVRLTVGTDSVTYLGIKTE